MSSSSSSSSRTPHRSSSRPSVGDRRQYRQELLRTVNEREKAMRTLERFKPERNFHTTLTFTNPMPEIPSGPHFAKIPAPYTNEQLGRYYLSSLESGFGWKMHIDPTLGLPLSMVDFEKWLVPADPGRLSEADHKLIKWHESGGKLGKMTESTPWLLKPKLMHNDLFAVPEKVQELKSQTHPFEPPPEEQEDQHAVDFISRSFEKASKRLTSDKPGVHVEWSIPVLPHEMFWANNYTQVTFAIDPDHEEDETDRSPRKRARDSIHEETEPARKVRHKTFDSLITNVREMPDERERLLMSLVTSNDPASGEYEWTREHIGDYKGSLERMVIILDTAPNADPPDEQSQQLLEDELKARPTYKSTRCSYVIVRSAISLNKASRSADSSSTIFNATVRRRPLDPWEKLGRLTSLRTVWPLEIPEKLAALGPRPSRIMDIGDNAHDTYNTEEEMEEQEEEGEQSGHELDEDEL